MALHVRAVRDVIGRLTVFAVLVWSLVSVPTATRAAEVLNIKDFAAGAVAAYNVCTRQQNGDDLCEDFIVTYGRFGGTRVGEGLIPNSVRLEHYRAFIHPDGTATELTPEVGFTDDVSGTFDNSHLTFARMGGATLPLYDVDPATGALSPNWRTATLGAFEWTAASGIYVFGNDGPFGFGLPRLFVNRCVTQIENAHERFSTARVTGTINGVSVDAYGPSYLPWPGTGPADALGAIFDNRFNIIITGHAPGC